MPQKGDSTVQSLNKVVPNGPDSAEQLRSPTHQIKKEEWENTMAAKMITDRRFSFRPPIPVKTTGIL